MDWTWLLFSFKGRIQRFYWWVPQAVVAVVVGVVGSIIEAVARAQGLGFVDPETSKFEPTGALGAALAVIGLAHLWIVYALGVKRLHDRDRTGWWLAAPILGIVFGVVMASLALSLPEGQREPWNGIGVFTVLGIFGLMLWLFLEIGFLPGTEGPNRFGPDPLGPVSSEARL